MTMQCAHTNGTAHLYTLMCSVLAGLHVGAQSARAMSAERSHDTKTDAIARRIVRARVHIRIWLCPSAPTANLATRGPSP